MRVIPALPITDFENINRLWGIILDKKLCVGLCFWLKGSRFKGSEVDFPATLTNQINGKGKKRDGINPEPGTLNL